MSCVPKVTISLDCPFMIAHYVYSDVEQDIKQRQANHKNKTQKNKKINNTVPTKN
jgi:hypothetical protein